MHFQVFFGHFWVLISPQMLPLAIYQSRSLLKLTTVWTSKKNIGLICLKNQLIVIKTRFCHFWSFLVIILTSMGPVLNSRVEFFAVISPLHSIEPILVVKLPLGEKKFIIFLLILKMCKKMHFRVFFGHF